MEDLSPTYLKCLLGGGYAVLIGVNWASLSGKLGAPNAEISKAYPSAVTPAGFAFSIWGPIFLLQGAGTIALLSNALPLEALRAVFPYWFVTWIWQNCWQASFVSLPLTDINSRKGKVFRTLLACACQLVAAQSSMTAAAQRLQTLEEQSLLRSMLLDFPSGVNAGWLSAASGIGLSLALQHWTRGDLMTPNRSACLLGAVGCYGAGVVSSLGQGSAWGFGLGYSCAVSWACFGITKTGSPEVVKKVARAGMGLFFLLGISCLVK
ncbi:unnamed protein product [Durusdinium trenchii]|uniref:Uncharacterized protein n=1 Tax=Durusdinium trenchii TaxID=1381693 RepID=A0ABP0PH59_9DINO